MRFHDSVGDRQAEPCSGSLGPRFAGATEALEYYCAAEIGFMLSVMTFEPAVLILSIPVAIALALLGPGAYSLDARIFGRRVITLPPDDRT